MISFFFFRFYFYSPNLSFAFSPSFSTSSARKSIKYYKPCLYRSTIAGNKSGQASINFAGPNSCTINSSTTVSPGGKSGEIQNTRRKYACKMYAIYQRHDARSSTTLGHRGKYTTVWEGDLFENSSSFSTKILNRVRDYNRIKIRSRGVSKLANRRSRISKARNSPAKRAPPESWWHCVK